MNKIKLFDFEVLCCCSGYKIFSLAGLKAKMAARVIKVVDPWSMVRIYQYMTQINFSFQHNFGQNATIRSPKIVQSYFGLFRGQVSTGLKPIITKKCNLTNKNTFSFNSIITYIFFIPLNKHVKPMYINTEQQCISFSQLSSLMTCDDAPKCFFTSLRLMLKQIIKSLEGEFTTLP